MVSENVEDLSGLYGCLFQAEDLDLGQQAAIEVDVIRLAVFTRTHPNPILISNLAGNIIDLNPAAKQVLQQLSIDAVQQFLPLNHRQMVETCWENQQGCPPIEVMVKKRSFCWSYHALSSLGLVYLRAIDITAQKQAEAELRDLIATTTALNRLASSELAALRLAQAIAQPKAASETAPSDAPPWSNLFVAMDGIAFWQAQPPDTKTEDESAHQT